MRRSEAILASTAALILVLDQVSKVWVRDSLPLGESTPALGRIVYLTHVRNTGAAFSIFQGNPRIFAVIAAAAVVGALAWWFVHRPAGRTLLFGLSLLIGGTLGNLVDRVRFGYVTDFIDVRVWPVFNVADIAVVSGAALLALAVLTDGREMQPAHGEGAAGGARTDDAPEEGR